ncbi:MAG: hypothetical protein WA840_06075 [Caulobacteraceae bacterium]
MIRRIVALIVAVAAMATAASVAVVAAAFAFYALLRPYLGEAGAAAALCGAAAVLMGLIGLIAFGRFKRRPAPKPEAKHSLADRLAEVVRDRPVAAAGAAAAAGLLAWRNPQLASVLLRIFDPAASRGGRRS